MRKMICRPGDHRELHDRITIAPTRKRKRSEHLKRQRGVAAVELALLFPILLLLLTLPLYFGRTLWHYEVACNATQDAARFLSGVPAIEIKNPGRINGLLAAANIIIQQETAELHPGIYAPVFTILCDGQTCDGFTKPSKITVIVRMQIDDIFFPAYSNFSIAISSRTDYPYVGI